ncbi:MAG: tryptophan synthase subunit alpha [Thermoplasmata archaeon]|nr:tryptophan synthase subunit alpha [Thermoplasmata archaeon]
MRLGDSWPRSTNGQCLTVPYVLVDRRRMRRLRSLAGALRDGGANALELGFPFSDPIADGPVLEAAAGRALAAGTTWSDLLAAARVTAPILPTAVMTYANPVWRHGLDRALAQLHGAGVGGLIVPDLSLEESRPWRQAARAADVDLVLLAAPGIDAERARRIARAARGFLYLVSRYGVTGAGGRQRADDLESLVRVARQAHPRLPVLVGFGVRDRASARAALTTGADGVIIGTALEERLAAEVSLGAITRWLRSISSLPAVGARRE